MKYVIVKEEGKVVETYGVVDETTSLYLTEANWTSIGKKKPNLERGVVYSKVFEKSKIEADENLSVEESVK